MFTDKITLRDALSLIAFEGNTEHISVELDYQDRPVSLLLRFADGTLYDGSKRLLDAQMLITNTFIKHIVPVEDVDQASTQILRQSRDEIKSLIHSYSVMDQALYTEWDAHRDIVAFRIGNDNKTYRILHYVVPVCDTPHGQGHLCHQRRHESLSEYRVIPVRAH